jgi:hypothetical protein
MCKLSLYKTNGYVWCKYFLCTQLIKLDSRKFKEIMKYKIVITCMFYILNYYLYVN